MSESNGAKPYQQPAPKFEPLEFSADHVRKDVPSWDWMEKDRETLVGLMLEASIICRPLSIIEIGTWAGATAIKFSDAGLTVYCVDHWRGGHDKTGMISEALGQRTLFRTFCANMGDRLFRSIIPCVGSSLTWAEVWPFQVSGVFIDADHEYEAVKADMQAWWPHVASGGVMAGHDVNLFSGVRTAFDEWKESHPDLKHGESGELWWTWKK